MQELVMKRTAIRLQQIILVISAFILVSFVGASDVDVEVDSVRDADSGIAAVGAEEGQYDDTINDDGENDDSESDNDSVDDYTDGEDEIAKQGYTHQLESNHEPIQRKKVFVPVFVPEKEKKKMKIIAVEKGFFVQGGTQLFGKFKSLKHCMKACAVDPTCFEGDFNPWLHKCYKHSNTTACGRQRSHPQYVHFSKVPCVVTDAPRGKITLGASMGNGIEVKGADNLQQCIKKCVNAGRGVVASVDTLGQQFALQACFGIDYDFASHRCYVFGANIVQYTPQIDVNSPAQNDPPVQMASTNQVVWTQCNLVSVLGSAQGAYPNPTVVHISFCPLQAG